MTDDSRVAELLLYWEEMSEQGVRLSAAELCADCPELRPEVERRLRALTALEPMLAGPATLPLPQAPVRVPAVAGTGYEILGELGRGAVGIVYRARHVKLNRVVALKLILAGARASEAERVRFLLEAQAAAGLQHPGIAQIYEIGEHDGLPFFSLEYCPGGSLAARLAGRPLEPREAARLVESLARAVQAAHERRIIHRDLKPGNVLLAEDGTPKITDFGLAKRLDEAGLTQTGTVMGTPSYMAPEQARGEIKAVGPLADVYALGAILYECLTGRPPFRAATAVDTLMQVSTDHPMPPARLQPTVPRDLQTICLKCLAKDAARRYPSALALADDLRRFLAGEPIVARPAGPVERALKWCRRRPALAAALSGVVVSTAAGFALVSWQWREAVAERDRAEQALYDTGVALAHSEWKGSNIGRAEALLDACPAARRGWEWHYLKRLCHRELFELGSEDFQYRGPAKQLWGVVHSPDGRYLAVLGPGTQVQLCDPVTGAACARLNEHADFVFAAAFDGAATLLATASADGTIRFWEPATGKETRPPLPLPDRKSAPRLALSRDGRLLAAITHVAGKPAIVTVWNMDTGMQQWQRAALPDVSDRRTAHLTFHPDGRRLAYAGGDAAVHVCAAASGKELVAFEGHDGLVRCIDYSRDGRLLASGSIDRTVRLWDAETGRLLHTCRGHAGVISGVAFRPDGSQVASCDENNTVRIWDVATGLEASILRGHHARVTGLSYSPDGRRLATTSWDGSVKVWDADIPAEASLVKRHGGAVTSVVFSPDGRQLASAADGGEVELWQSADGALVRRFPGDNQGHHPGTRLALSPDGRRLAATASDGSIRVWDAATGTEETRLKDHTGPTHAVAFSADGRQLASGGVDPVLRIRDAISWANLRDLNAGCVNVVSLRFSPDGKRLLALDGDARRTEMWQLALWDTATGELLSARASKRNRPHHQPAFSPDGRYLAWADLDAILVFDVSSGIGDETMPRWRLQGHVGAVRALAFSPDGSRLASGGTDHTVRLWDTASGEVTLTLRGHDNYVVDLAFSPDGQTLASASWDRTVKLWDARPIGSATAPAR